MKRYRVPVVQFCPNAATGTKPTRKVLHEHVVEGAQSEAPPEDFRVTNAVCNLSETQRALVSEIIESWGEKKSPIIMKKVGFCNPDYPHTIVQCVQ